MLFLSSKVIYTLILTSWKEIIDTILKKSKKKVVNMGLKL